MDKSVKWLYASECDGGGLSAWNDDGKWMNAYPEVTGYLLPTLINYNAGDLAMRCGEWLLTQQNDNGSWNGLDGVQRPFDTSAIIEGLAAMFEYTYEAKYKQAVNKSRAWMNTMITSEGYLQNSPASKLPEIYNLRASAIIGNKKELAFWQSHGLNKGEARAHYLAYALEGALNIDPDNKWAIAQIEMAYTQQTGFIPFYVRPDWGANHPSVDYCATAQMGILYHRVGLDPSRVYRLLESVVAPDGGIAQSNDDARQILWSVKFYLDLKAVMQ
jgi:hypothetical protein